MLRLPVLVGGIAAPHAGEGGVAPALQGQMKLGAEAAREDTGLVHVAALLTDSLFLWTRTCWI